MRNISAKRFRTGNDHHEPIRAKKLVNLSYGMPREGFEMFDAVISPNFRG